MLSLSQLSAIRSILFSVALLLLGNGLINTLLTLRGTGEGFSVSLMGVIMSAYFVGFICGTWVSGRLIRRMGHIRTFAFCASICASAALLHLVLVEAWVWILLRFVFGLAYITLITVIESWLNGQAASHERGRVFAFYMMVNLGALAAAQQILRLDTADGFLLFVAVAVLICWAMLPITLTQRPQPVIPDRPRSSLMAMLRLAPVPVVAAALSGLAMGAFWAMAPIHAASRGMDAGDVGLVMSLAILGGALLQVPIGRFSDHHDRRSVLFWVTCAAAAVALTMPLASSNVMLMALYFLWGGLAFALYPLAVAQLVDQLHPDEIVSGTSDMLVLHGAGCAVAPVLVGVVMQLLGSSGLPLYIGCVLGIMAFYLFYRRQHVTDLVAGDMAAFQPLMQSGGEAVSAAYDGHQPDLFDDIEPARG